MTDASPSVIDPKIDVYGRDGRTGAIADLIEFRAIKGIRTSAADLADLVVQMDWASLPKRQVLLDASDVDEAPEPLADQTFALLDERRTVLTDKYPFTFSFGQLVLKEEFDLPSSPYMALLAITLAHAWRVPCHPAPEAALEAVVAEALGQILAAVSLGTGDRAGRSFIQTLGDGARSVGLTAAVDPLPRRVRAKDAGVDTLLAHVWPDERPGHLVLIGQVTCGQTDIWSSKLNEPKPAIWKGYLQEPLTPGRFLAVPHHVDARFLQSLHLQDEGMVVDRLRLTLSLASGTASVRPVVDAILAASAA